MNVGRLYLNKVARNMAFEMASQRLMEVASYCQPRVLNFVLDGSNRFVVMAAMLALPLMRLRSL